jgi:hypothetical protein
MTELSDTVPRKLPASAQGQSRQLTNSDRLSGFRPLYFRCRCYLSNCYETARKSSRACQQPRPAHRDGVMNSSQLDCRKAAADFIDQLMKLAAVRLTDKMIVIGCDQIEVFVGLAARGFFDITCRAVMQGPNERDLDLIIAPGIRSEAEMLDVLSRFACSLRHSGALVLGIGGSPAGASQQGLQRTLAQYGLVIVRKQTESTGFHILLARKFPRLQAQAA